MQVQEREDVQEEGSDKWKDMFGNVLEDLEATQVEQAEQKQWDHLPHELASVEWMEPPEHPQRCLEVCRVSMESQGV